MNPASLKITGRLINAAGLVSPRVAGRMAFSIFTRTGRPEPNTEKERALFAEAQPRMAEARRETVTVRGHGVAVHVFPPTAPANGKRLLFTHGWGSRIAFAQGLITGLRAAGYEVFGIDLPGHGDSPAKMLHAGIAVETIAAVWQSLGPFDVMVGHSFGGFMSVLASHGAMGGARLSPGKIVLIASPADVRPVLGNFVGALGLKQQAAQALAGALERATGRSIEAAFAPRYLRESRIPTLVLHASEDKEVGAAAARAYAEAGENVTLRWLDGLGHRRIVNSPEAIDAIKSFVGS